MPVGLDFATLDLQDALDLAILIEVEAMERYKLFAEQIGRSYPGDPASVFAMMADNEKKHADELEERRQQLFGKAPRRVSPDALYDVEAPNVGAIRWDMSVRHAYELALSSEKKAFSFYDEALPFVKNDEVRKLFVELRDEETEHVELLEEAMAELPESADWTLEDLDD